MASVKMPTAAELAKVGSELGMNLSDSDIAFFQETMAGNVAAYSLLESLPDNLPKVKYPRTPGYRPDGAENKYNLWYYKSEIKGAAEGKLKGKRVALKDNVCVAGVPMMNGASTLEGYMPDVDATVVTRVLDAGATVVGKVHCEYFCFSGGSHTSSPGPVHNPRKYGYSAGGSSSGSAAIIVTGEADMAIGGDQGGSIRMPSAYCGIVGLKPTWGLVPYTGIMPIELTLDHTGPMTATVADNALMLEAIAGPDGLDPRQMGCTVDAYTKALGGSAAGLKIGVVKEGFGHPQSEKVVDELVQEGRRQVQGAGRHRRGGLDPLASHRHGGVVGDRRRRRHLADDAGQRLRLQLEGPLRHQPGRCALGVARARRRALRHAQDHDPVRQVCAQQVSRPLLRQGAEPRRASWARPTTTALAKYDLLLMPTLPLRADQAARSGRPAHGHHQPRLRDAAQHRAVRRHRPSGDHAALRHERGTAGRADADRQALEQIDDLQSGRRLRKEPRLEEGQRLAAPKPTSDLRHGLARQLRAGRRGR